MDRSSKLFGLFQRAHSFCRSNYPEEITIVESRRFPDQNARSFLLQYVYVVINSGMKNQVADKIFAKFYRGLDASAIGHPGKRKAVEQALAEHEKWFINLQQADDKLAYLDSLPWIGPITKYHLARNLGLDYAKPDRHMSRLAHTFGYNDNVQKMCEDISRKAGLRVGTVDVILWRYLSSKDGKTDE